MLAPRPDSAVHSQHLPVHLREVFPSTFLQHHAARARDRVRDLLLMVVVRAAESDNLEQAVDRSEENYAGKVHRHHLGEWRALPTSGFAYSQEVLAGDDGLGRSPI